MEKNIRGQERKLVVLSVNVQSIAAIAVRRNTCEWQS